MTARFVLLVIITIVPSFFLVLVQLFFWIPGWGVDIASSTPVILKHPQIWISEPLSCVSLLKPVEALDLKGHHALLEAGLADPTVSLSLSQSGWQTGESNDPRM